MRIGIFDPYLDTLGGGEKYILTIAEILSKNNQVLIFWNNPQILKEGSKRFNLNLEKVKTTQNIFSSTSLINKVFETGKYDAIFYISDGSIPFLFAKKNILIFQFPVNWVKKSFLTDIKLSKVTSIICYSEFVKKFLQEKFSKNIAVLQPSVDAPSKTNSKKENFILNVGRFTKGMNMKKQEMLIEAFKKLKEKNWKLVLLGGVLPEDKEFVENLIRKTKGLPIEIKTNVSAKLLTDYYSKAKIYWHATGFGEDLTIHPEFAEHFGITTVEAMSYGAVPVVINAGGQTETVENNKDGFLWTTEEELLEKTRSLINDPNLLENISKNAKVKAQKFSKEGFAKRITELIV